MIRRSRSVTETATSAAQKNAATAASAREAEGEHAGRDEQRGDELDERVLPRDRRAAGAAAAAEEHVREQRDVVVPRDGRLARHARRGGLTTERPSGTRAATTFRKLPSARPGNERDGCERGGHAISYRRLPRGASVRAGVAQDDVVLERVPLPGVASGVSVDRQVDAERCRAGRLPGGGVVREHRAGRQVVGHFRPLPPEHAGAAGRSDAPERVAAAPRRPSACTT